MAPVISESVPDGKQQAVRLDESDPTISEISDIVAKAGTAWLKNEEVLAVLEFFVEKRADLSLVFPDVAGTWRTPGCPPPFRWSLAGPVHGPAKLPHLRLAISRHHGFIA
jgi:hypothetical protein